MEKRERLKLAYTNQSNTFLLNPSDFENERSKFFKRQFIFLYRSRIGFFRDIIIECAQKALG